jgi:cell volume regulation protein A
MAVPLVLFALVGGALVAGYVGHLVFRRFRVSDISFMLVLGLLVGPVLGLVDPKPLAGAMPFLSPLALVIVLFEGGLELAWEDIRAHAGAALRLGLLTWALTGVLVAAAAHFALGLAWVLSLLFGYAVAATGMLVVIPLLAQLKAPPDARVILTVETSLGDLLSAVVVATVAGMIVAGGTLVQGGVLLASRFVVGSAVGLLAGIAWARLVHRLRPDRHAYPFTLAALLLTYVAAEALGGSGFLAALAFGLFLGNARALMSLGGIADLAPLPRESRGLGSELIFLLRSVYFVFLGLSVPRSILTPGFALAGLALLAALIAARAIGVAVAARRSPSRGLLFAMMPRGLATAVIAALPAAMGVPGTESFSAYVFLVIIGSDLATSGALWWVSRRGRPGGGRHALAAPDEARV